MHHQSQKVLLEISMNLSRLLLPDSGLAPVYRALISLRFWQLHIRPLHSVGKVSKESNLYRWAQPATHCRLWSADDPRYFAFWRGETISQLCKVRRLSCPLPECLFLLISLAKSFSMFISFKKIKFLFHWVFYYYFFSISLISSLIMTIRFNLLT